MKYVPLIYPTIPLKMTDVKNTIELLSQLSKEERVDELLPVAQQIVEDLSKETEKNFIQPTEEFFPKLQQRVDGTEKMEVIPTGFRDIDNRVYWVAKWNIMTICARTGWWKTTLWLNMAVNMCQNYKVGFISLEMTKEELLDKIVSRVAHVKSNSLAINRFSDWDKTNLNENLAKAKDVVGRITFAFDCFNIEEIVSVINQMADIWVEVVFLDWLWMVEAEGWGKWEQLRVVMTKLKQVALARNIWIVTMQQLNRDADSDNWSGPFMRDIADSSAIEKISSPVLIMRRSWDDKTTDVRLFKMRRLNSDLLEEFYNDKKIVDPRDEFCNIRLWENLTYSEFTDYTKPF